MLHTPEWARGDTAQRRWAEKLRERGLCVLPTYAFEDVTKETKAPVMLVPDGIRVTPDLLSFAIRERTPVVWHEVKSKSTPTWYRKLGRWEHGFDHDLVEEYQAVQIESFCPVWIIVNELSSPIDPTSNSPLVPGDAWLGALLASCIEHGDHRADWPGGSVHPSRRGRRGKGGLLWPRSVMRDVTRPRVTA